MEARVKSRAQVGRWRWWCKLRSRCPRRVIWWWRVEILVLKMNVCVCDHKREIERSLHETAHRLPNWNQDLETVTHHPSPLTQDGDHCTVPWNLSAELVHTVSITCTAGATVSSHPDTPGQSPAWLWPWAGPGRLQRNSSLSQQRSSMFSAETVSCVGQGWPRGQFFFVRMAKGQSLGGSILDGCCLYRRLLGRFLDSDERWSNSYIITSQKL